MGALLFFRALPWLAKIATIGAVALTIWGGYALWKHTIYQEGRADEKAAVQDQNRKANNAARAGIKNVDDCYDRGGAWNASSGLCE